MINIIPDQEIALLRSIIQETQTLTLSTVEFDGSCRATPLFYWASEIFYFFCLSSVDSQHTLNLKRDPRVSVAIYPAVRSWIKIRGLQIKGRATILFGSERKLALSQYKKRYPFIGELINLVNKSELIQIQPEWMRLIDNRRGFGHHQEWQVS